MSDQLKLMIKETNLIMKLSPKILIKIHNDHFKKEFEK